MHDMSMKLNDWIFKSKRLNSTFNVIQKLNMKYSRMAIDNCNYLLSCY